MPTSRTGIVADIAKAKGVDEVVKIKSMVTQEIDLNEYLESVGIAAWETDLAELIVQLGHDLPSHILVPAIHRNRSEVREIFVEEMGRYGAAAPVGLSDDPTELTQAARAHLREKFLRSTMAVSGGNFIVAETGTLVIVESEGNGRMCLTLPETLVSIVGIEKILPTVEDLEVFLKLLPRSSTGERMNPYTSFWSGVTPGDGPQDLHVILLDNGRSRALADPVGRAALRCIRCSACLNICPVYERVGGHAYGSPYPGPIGAILNPLLKGVDDKKTQALPFASTLCGACNDVCPVRIPFTDILVHLRHQVVEHKTGKHPTVEQGIMKTAAWVLSDGKHLEKAQLATRAAGKLLKGRYLGPMPVPLVGRWLRARDVEAPPTETFRQWWISTRTSGRSRDERARRHPPEGPDRHTGRDRGEPDARCPAELVVRAATGDGRCAGRLRRESAGLPGHRGPGARPPSAAGDRGGSGRLRRGQRGAADRRTASVGGNGSGRGDTAAHR